MAGSPHTPCARDGLRSFFGFGTEIKNVATGSVLVITSRLRGLCVAVLPSPGSRHRLCPPGMQGGCPEPAMDGRRPELGAGQRIFRLGIRLASPAGGPSHPEVPEAP